MAAEKPRHRVKAGSKTIATAVPRPAPRTMAHLRDGKAGILNMRRAITRDAKVDILASAERAAALAIDFIQNSGWVAGAVAQIVVDTIGVELKLNCRAALKGFGYSDEEVNDWARAVEAAWLQWAWNPKECDLGGEMTIAEMTDAIVRSYLAYGEGFGILDYLTVRRRRTYGIRTGLKVSLVAPHRCPRVSREFEGLDSGIFRDALNRPTAYRFRRREGGIERDHDVSARDVIHVMDRGEHLNAGRGITPIAPVLRVLAQSDQLADATLAVALMQQAFAAIIKSPEASKEAFEAIQGLDDGDVPEGYDPQQWTELIANLHADLVEVWSERFTALKDGSVSLNDPARVAHLGPGEELEMVQAAQGAGNYITLSQNLLKEVARCLGVTFESFTGDHSHANYSSVRMAVASIWPIVMRRRQRIAVPFIQSVYEAWLDESIYEGRIPFKGGYAAFSRDREAVFQAEFQGPERPTADPYKDALASKILMELVLSSHADEAIARGRNPTELLTQVGREILTMTKDNIPVPFGRTQGGAAGPNGSAAPGRREPASEDA